MTNPHRALRVPRLLSTLFSTSLVDTALRFATSHILASMQLSI